MPEHQGDGDEAGTDDWGELLGQSFAWGKRDFGRDCRLGKRRFWARISPGQEGNWREFLGKSVAWDKRAFEGDWRVLPGPWGKRTFGRESRPGQEVRGELGTKKSKMLIGRMSIERFYCMTSTN